MYLFISLRVEIRITVCQCTNTTNELGCLRKIRCDEEMIRINTNFEREHSRIICLCSSNPKLHNSKPNWLLVYVEERYELNNKKTLSKCHRFFLSSLSITVGLLVLKCWLITSGCMLRILSVFKCIVFHCPSYT